MVTSQVSCEPGFHCGSCTCELGTKGIFAVGTSELPGTTGGVTVAAIRGKAMLPGSTPTRNAFVGSLPPLPGQVALVVGARHSRLCPKPTACRGSMVVCTPFK